jgi:hypothetical protein
MAKGPMIGENRQLVTDEPVEVRDFRRITDHFRGILWSINQINMEKSRDVNM